jgi:D-serine deaminase-like pyridoxal phosphate-dependent protein
MAYADQIDTPALIVHQAILERNVEAMAQRAAAHGVALRPHFKTHKTAEVVRLQQQHGAKGITCAKVGEAEVVLRHGVADDVLIANQIVGQLKLDRLQALLKQARITVAVDSLPSAAGLDALARAADTRLPVLIEVNTGLDRAGVLPGHAALDLAQTLRAQLPRLDVIGVMTHEGHVYRQPDAHTAATVGAAAATALVETAHLLREQGFPISIVSAGSTPGATGAVAVPGISELRPGTYVFNDATGLHFGLRPDDCALRILATVTSRPAPDRVIIDAGSKVLTSDGAVGRSGHGYVVGYPDMVVARLSEEHGVVLVAPGTGPQVGDKLEIIPNHVCPTVNLTDTLYIVQDGELIGTWPVIGRGQVR